MSSWWPELKLVLDATLTADLLRGALADDEAALWRRRVRQDPALAAHVRRYLARRLA